MERITDFAEVDYIVPYGTVLPDEISKTLAMFEEVYVVNRRTGQEDTRYHIPRYLMTQWLAKYDPAHQP